MALFSLFRRLSFFRGRSTEGMSEDDIDFKKWIQAHRDWRLRLANYIAGTSAEKLDAEVICRDDRCPLGQWIYGSGGRYYGDLEIFRDMRHHHADFHRSAGAVVRCFHSEGEAAANRLMQRDYDRDSLRVIGALEKLERTIRQGR